MKHEPINDIWRNAAETAFGLNRPGISDAQRVEMKRAFFAGWQACQGMLSQLAANLSEDEAAERLSRYHDETRGFAEAIKLGKA